MQQLLWYAHFSEVHVCPLSDLSACPISLPLSLSAMYTFSAEQLFVVYVIVLAVQPFHLSTLSRFVLCCGVVCCVVLRSRLTRLLTFSP